MTLARVEDQGDRLVVINMNATRRGALSPEFYACIRDAIARAEDPKIRAVVLTSEGDFFCAGGDLNLLQERRNLTQEGRRQKIQDLHDVIDDIRSSPVPVIAAVEGGAAGAGFSIALACDFIVASETANFTASYVKAGLVPDGGLTASLARSVPRPLAMQLCVLAEPVSSARLAAHGVVTHLVDAGQAKVAAMDLAEQIAQGPRAAQWTIRAMVTAAYDTSFAQQLDAERNAMADAVTTDEAAEGIAAFLEKRRPDFRA